MVRQRSAAMEQEKLAQRANTDQRLSGHGAPSVSNAANVAGRKTVGPQEGFGPLWRKVYRVRLHGAAVTPQQVIAEWKAHFNRFWPANANFYKPLTGIQPGEVAFVDLQPGGAPLSTGMLVLDVDETSFTLMTPQGHMFAGWLTFSAHEEQGVTVAQIRALIRANDPLYEIGLRLGGHASEDRFWRYTLTGLAAYFGVRGHVETECACLDPHLQWRYVGNIRYNAVLVTLLTLPARWFGQRRPCREKRG
jgi:hypothetical protein